MSTILHNLLQNGMRGMYVSVDFGWTSYISHDSYV